MGEWSGLRESNSRLNLGKVSDKLQKRRKWRLFQGYYCPCICPKFQSASRIYVFTAGDWTNANVYHLTVVPVDIS